MQVRPDWSDTWTKEQFELELAIRFDGPGLYLTEDDTMLVVPLPLDRPATVENVWHSVQPAGTVYDVYVWNTNSRNTIFAAIAVAPVRTDSREGRVPRLKQWRIDLCKDGTLTVRQKNQQPFDRIKAGDVGALPVHFTDTAGRARQLVIAVGKVQYKRHQLLPNELWYRLVNWTDDDGNIRTFIGNVDDLIPIGRFFERLEKQMK